MESPQALEGDHQNCLPLQYFRVSSYTAVLDSTLETKLCISLRGHAASKHIHLKPRNGICIGICNIIRSRTFGPIDWENSPPQIVEQFIQERWKSVSNEHEKKNKRPTPLCTRYRNQSTMIKNVSRFVASGAFNGAGSCPCHACRRTM